MAESLAIDSVLRALAGALLLPPGPLLLMLGLALVLRRRRPRQGALLGGIALLGLWSSCTDIGADALERQLIAPTPVLPAQQARTLAASPGTMIWVLGAGAHRLRPEYAGAQLKPLTLERLRYGLWLADRTGLGLGFSGGVGWRAEPGSPSEASLAQELVRQQGRELALVEDASRDTRENAGFSIALLERAGIRQLVLVTHVQHMPRAMRAFEQAAAGRIRLIAAPVGVAAPGPSSLGDWLPSNSGYLRFRYAAYEWMAWHAGH